MRAVRGGSNALGQMEGAGGVVGKVLTEWGEMA